MSQPFFNHIQRGRQGITLLLRKIVAMVFILDGKQDELALFVRPVIDNPDATSDALVSALIPETNLTQSACFGYHITLFRVSQQHILKSPKLIITQIVSPVFLKVG
ncbi:hypothetical protein [Pantoea vagans]|uniref:hypothetical protein n=1 Tax=Pantoea vagans TaxID=470934 RepID=UPI003B0114A7